MAVSVRVALLLGFLALPGGPAAAQSPPPSMFGFGASPRPYHYPGMSPYRLRTPYGGPFSPYQPDGDEAAPLARGGTYRTLCVRLCDGFYYPISSAVTQDGLARDADACSAGCGTEARLFFHPSISGDVDSMVDLTGMAYGALRNAYKYRKTLVEGCRCRPQPWSEAERERHLAYAEEHSAAHVPRDAEVIAGGDKTQARSPPGTSAAGDYLASDHLTGADRLSAPSSDQAHILARPPPIERQIEPAPVWLFPSPGNRGIPRSRYEWPGGHSSR
jgi:hypothetical protein